MDLDTRLLVEDLRPAIETSVVCRVEDLLDADGVLIVSMVDNGAAVKKGDGLCRLDASGLEDHVRQVEIAADQARGTRDQAFSGLEVARIAPRHYEQGTTRTLGADFGRRIALAKSDGTQLSERISWTERMVIKGYATKRPLMTERQELAKANHELTKAEGEYRLFRETRTRGRS